MMYLIGQLAGWLVLTAAFAALAGWAWAAQRAAAGEAAQRQQRNRLIDDLAGLAAGGGEPRDEAEEREIDTMRRLFDVNASRVAELERLLAGARAAADEHASRAAELEREIERRAAEAAARPAALEGVVDVDAEPADDGETDAVALQGWRLRYFEQRVRYLESLGAAVPAAATEAVSAPLAEWRARVAEARSTHLEDALRAAAAPAAEVPPEAGDGGSPFAASAEVDVLLRWRMLYLERRVAHLQAQARDEAPVPLAEAVALADAAPDPDRWKWRAHYLEARLRHLEAHRPLAVSLAAGEEEAETPAAAPPPSVPTEKPVVLAAARHGAPDDLRLIEGVSALQQSTLNALGVWHFDQIAAWTAANVAWVDRYFRLRGRIDAEEWVAQAAELAREGPAAVRRHFEESEA